MAKASRRKGRQDERTGQKHEVRIDIGGQVSWIDETSGRDGRIQSLVIPLLKYEARVFEQGGSLGYQEHVWEFALHDLRLGKQASFPTGFVPRVVRVLKRHGYHVRIIDHREFGKRFAVDEHILQNGEPESLLFPKIIQKNPLGQIEVAGRKDLIEAMRSVILLYPKARVLIPVGTKKIANEICDKLNAVAMDFSVGLRGRRWPNPPPRCLICMFSAIDAFCTKGWDIILLPDVEGATSEVGARAMAQFNGRWDQEAHRVYSFFQRGERLDRVDRIRLEAMSGPVICRVSPTDAKVQVLWLPTPRCPAVDWNVPRLTFKRAAYWHNDRRNDYVAAVARAVANRDSSKLHKYGFPFSDGEPILRHPEHPKIVLLVASTEQARESWLAACRNGPCWTLYPTTSKPRTSKSPGKATRRPAGSLRRCGLSKTVSTRTL